MLRKALTLFTIFTLFLFSFMLRTQEESSPTVQPDPYAAILGDWADSSHQLYVMDGITVTFSDDLRDSDKVRWLEYLEESFDLLPPHLQTSLNGLLMSFNSGNTCVEDGYLGCFTRHDFSIFVSTTKQSRERDNIRTILHEIGHAVDYSLDPSGPMLSEELHNNKYRPTRYSGKNQYEDFAESFALYILSPGYMLSKSEARYEFMRDKVFLGKEYFK